MQAKFLLKKLDKNQTKNQKVWDILDEHPPSPPKKERTWFLP